MDYNFKGSINRAIKLLNTPQDYKNYLIIKIRPQPFRCCHFRHWPETWEIINKHISPSGPIKEEGDALIQKNKEFREFRVTSLKLNI